jgi:hypothetical protein
MSITFDCPMCHKSQGHVEIKTPYGKPKFKLQTDLGDGQNLTVLDISFTVCQQCRNMQFFFPSERFGLLTE